MRHKSLFVENLPPSTQVGMLNMLFGQYPGLQEVRLVDARPGIAFVDFESEPTATAAMEGLDKFNVSAGHALKITYAKQG